MPHRPTHKRKPTHHTGRVYLRVRLQVLERDQWVCQLPVCKAAGWLANPPAKDKVLADMARAWARHQGSTRAIWRDAPRIGHRLHPLSASADMDPPKSRGGDDKNPAHLRASHLLCNVSRGDGRRERPATRWTTSAPRIAPPK